MWAQLRTASHLWWYCRAENYNPSAHDEGIGRLVSTSFFGSLANRRVSLLYRCTLPTYWTHPPIGDGVEARFLLLSQNPSENSRKKR